MYRDQSWLWAGSIHMGWGWGAGLGWVGLGCLFSNFVWVGLGSDLCRNCCNLFCISVGLLSETYDFY